MVLVVDFGSQYNMLIVRKVRELNVACELIQVDKINQIIEDGNIKNYDGVIFSGGPNIVTDESALKINEKIFSEDIAILGICYGMQLIGEYYNSSLIESPIKEYGKQEIIISEDCKLFANLDKTQNVWMSHGYEINNVGKEVVVTARSKDGVIAAINIKDKNIYAMQFHPEVTDSENGLKMISNFIDQTTAVRDYTMHNFLEHEIEEIKKVVGKEHVICGLSGGVDSTVVAALLNKAIPGQVRCILIDNGLLRKNEATLVIEELTKQEIEVEVIDAKDLFLEKLKDVKDPETKRKIIGKLFIDVFNEQATKFSDAKFLAQGTLYTDVIESGTATAHTIKSHHNVGGLPEDMKFELIEPLNKLFKDEVRLLGTELGLSQAIVSRQPFPGPGLAIRIMGAITEEKLEIVRESDYIFRSILAEHGVIDSIWQCFTVLTNTKTVGVKGDERSYEYVLALRAINSIDGMTARASMISLEILLEVSKEITNRVRKINRVVYDITNKPPSTIEWE